MTKLSNSVFDFLDDFADVMQVFDVSKKDSMKLKAVFMDLILLDLMLPEKGGFQVLKTCVKRSLNSCSHHDC